MLVMLLEWLYNWHMTLETSGHPCRCWQLAMVSHIQLQTVTYVNKDVMCSTIHAWTHDHYSLSCIGRTFLKFHNLNTLMGINSLQMHYSFERSSVNQAKLVLTQI